MELHEVEKQVILYSKGHFKQINYQQDLKYFAAELYDLNPEQVELYSIVNMVTDIYQTLVGNGLIDFNFKNFLSWTFRRAYRETSKNEVSWNIVLREMLAQIQGMQVLGTGLELGKADLSIIPEPVS